MRERTKGKTLVAKDEGDDANGVLIKLYGEETNGAISIIELYTPGGFQLSFKDFGDRLRRGPVGLEELNRLGEPHGIRFFDGRIARRGLWWRQRCPKRTRRSCAGWSRRSSTAATWR
jgi:hypothetical protein